MLLNNGSIYASQFVWKECLTLILNRCRYVDKQLCDRRQPQKWIENIHVLVQVILSPITYPLSMLCCRVTVDCRKSRYREKLFCFLFQLITPSCIQVQCFFFWFFWFCCYLPIAIKCSGVFRISRAALYHYYLCVLFRFVFSVTLSKKL